MTTRNSRIKPIPLEMKAGVRPFTDGTALSTDHWTWSKGIRFVNGLPRKIGGWVQLSYTGNSILRGVIRSLYSTVFGSGAPQLLIGSSYGVYNYTLDGKITNLTPLETETTSITSASTTYYSLPTSSLSSQSGSNILTVNDLNANLYRVGDIVEISSATAFNGLSTTVLNSPHVIRSITNTSYTFQVNDEANATGLGGGTPTISSGLVKVTVPNDMNEADRVKLTGFASFGGIDDVNLNQEFIARNVSNTEFSVMTIDIATSLSSSTDGEFSRQIQSGPVDESYSQGYGAGLYGAGLYGASNVSSTTRIKPRIWYFDKFGDSVIMTPGGIVYAWNGENMAAPSQLANSPIDVNYVFVSDNIVVTLGAGGVGNKIFASDQGNPTQWTASSLNQVYEDNIEGAGTFLSHCPVSGQNLLFTETQTYTFRYIGLDAGVWQIKRIDSNIGIISPLARVSVKGKAFWMGQDNFYMYRGNDVEIIPANTQGFSTILNYVFKDINREQSSKCFALYNLEYNEVEFHYPSAESNEPNRVARVSLNDYSWCPDEINRTASEQSGFYFKKPFMANGVDIFQHEIGFNDVNSVLPFTLTTNLRTMGKDSTLLVNLVPDSVQNENISVNIKQYEYPQKQETIFNNTVPVQPITPNIPLQLSGHFWNYTISGEKLNQNWMMGQWYEYVQQSSPT